MKLLLTWSPRDTDSDEVEVKSGSLSASETDGEDLFVLELSGMLFGA